MMLTVRIEREDIAHHLWVLRVAYHIFDRDRTLFLVSRRTSIPPLAHDLGRTLDSTLLLLLHIHFHNSLAPLHTACMMRMNQNHLPNAARPVHHFAAAAAAAHSPHHHHHYYYHHHHHYHHANVEERTAFPPSSLLPPSLLPSSFLSFFLLSLSPSPLLLLNRTLFSLLLLCVAGF